MPSAEQRAAAENIITAFLVGGYRYALLMAHCQSGKTGCFQEVARQMLETGQCERVYILCGSNETELRDQAKADTAEANPGAAIEVLFRQDFKGAAMDLKKALVIVDESHLDQTQGQELDTFLSRHGLSMDGNPAALVANGAFLLSVDATPYAELAALTHKETPYAKHVEELKPGAAYYGLADYMHSGNLRPTFEISPKAYNAFGFRLKKCVRKYALIRVSKGKDLDAIRACARAVGAQVLMYTADTTEVAIVRKQQVELKKRGINVPCLEDAPTVTTIVIIKNRLRAGKVVPKRHIGFVWEGAQMSKTDSLVQGLPGRMCGYVGEGVYNLDADTKPMIFLPQSALERREKKVVKASEMERAIMGHPCALPTIGSNLAKGHIANATTNGTVQLPPLRLEWPETDSDEWTPQTAEQGDDIGEYCRDFLMKNMHAVDAAPFSQAQKDEIKSFVAKAYPHKRSLQAGCSDPFKKYFGAVIEAHGTKTAVAEHVADFPEMTFFITKDAIVPGANCRHLYVVFYTKAGGLGGGIMQAALKSRIPKTNGKSHFSIHDGAFDQPIVAGGVVGFAESQIRTPEMLESAMRAYLVAAQTPGLTAARCIQSVDGRFALSKAAYAWQSSKVNGVESVCAKLSAEFGVKLKPKYARSADGHFNVKTITW